MKRKLLIFLIIFIASLVATRDLFKPGYFPMHDDMQAMRVLQMDKCVKDGQIPCRWVPDMGYGYGYPQFIYYSPLPYYIMEIFHLLGFSILDSVKAGFILSFLLSGLAMFLLGKSLWGDLGGLVSSIFYIFAPYRASDVYTRGAVGEFWALVFMPLIFWAILEYIKEEKFKYLAWLALPLAGLLTTHNITSMIFIPVVCLWCLFLLWELKKWHLFPKIILGFVWGVAFAGFFVFPLIFEKKFAHVETMFVGYFNYLAHFVSLRQLFTSTHWGFGSSELGPYDDLSFSIGIFHWLFSFLGVAAAFLIGKRERIFKIIVFLFLIFLGSAYITHQRSVFLWNKIPLLAYLQFPWRFLTLVTFSTSILSGSIIYFVKDYYWKFFLAILMIFGVIFLNAFYFRPQEWYYIDDAYKFSGEPWEKQLTISIFDYLPIFAKMPPDKKASELPEIIEGEGKILSYQKGSDWQKGKISVFSDEAKIQLPLFYFPGFKAWVAQELTDIDYQNDLGLITLKIPKGEREIFVKLTRTFPRLTGDFLTLASFILLVYLAFFKKNVFESKI